MRKKYLTVKHEFNINKFKINSNSKKNTNIEMRIKRKDLYYYLLGSKKKFYIEKFKKYVCFESIIKFNEEWENHKLNFSLKKESLNLKTNNNFIIDKNENENNKLI